MLPRVYRDVTAVALAKGLVSAGVLAIGFRAISDDDYARVVIAQQFAAAPSLDPSGTSWLPFPFWVFGTPMLALGPSLALARAVAVVQGIVAALLVYAAGAWFGLPRGARLAGALLGCAFPYAAWTGVATVPDGLTPALLLLGCAAQQQDAPLGRRTAGAVALTAAALSRYEAWPVVACCAALGLVYAVRRGSAKDAAIALVPLLAPVLWMANGLFEHGDPLFFVTRVAAYRRALALESGSSLARALSVLLAPLRFEPELVAITALALSATYRRGLPLGRFRPLAWALGAELLFLIIGELGAAGPTHHGERALLLFWLACAVLAGHAGSALFRDASPARRLGLAAAAVGVIALVALVARPRVTPLEPFARRADEEAIGHAARLLCPRGSVAIDAPDFGFFAVMAAFGYPDRTHVLDDHDPRRPRPPDPFVDRVALRDRLGEPVRCLVAWRKHAAIARQLGRPRAQEGEFVLVELDDPKRSRLGEEVSRETGQALP